MTPASEDPSPFFKALWAGLLVGGLRALAFFRLGREVDDPVGGSLTIGYGLVTALITAFLVFLVIWIGLPRGAIVRTVAGLLLALLLGWTVRTMVLTELLRSDYAAARAPESSPERLRELDLDDEIIQHRLADNPTSPPDLLRGLSERPTPHTVRSRLARNPNTPPDVLEQIEPPEGY